MKNFFFEKIFYHRFKNLISEILSYRTLMYLKPLRRAHQMSWLHHRLLLLLHIHHHLQSPVPGLKITFFEVFWAKNFQKKNLRHRLKNFITEVLSYNTNYYNESSRSYHDPRFLQPLLLRLRIHHHLQSPVPGLKNFRFRDCQFRICFEEF